MSAKREFEDGGDSETTIHQPKRAKTKDSKTRQHQNSGIDPTWGQKYVFSGVENATTIPEGEESDFEDDADAMAYLMSVRHEASAIPHLLVAPKVQIGPQLPAGFEKEQNDDDDEEEEGELEENIETISIADSRGFYEDGAYIGISNGWENNHGNGEPIDTENPEHREKELNEAYFTAIMDQYIHLRKLVHSTPPENAASRLSPSQLTEAAPFGRFSSTTKTWTSLIRDSEPHPIQIALMSKDTVILVLRVIIGGKFLRSGHTISERTSQWLWALLARLPEAGEMNYSETGWVRDLGRRAVLLGRSLSEMAALRDELAESGFGANDNVDASSSDDDEVTAEAFEGGGDNNDSLEEEAGEHTNSAVDDPTVLPANGEDKVGDNLPEDIEDGELKEEVEEKEDSDDGDVAMDITSDSEADEGEINETLDDAAALEEAKSKLLARLAEAEDERRQEEQRLRARMNMRATLNMILTVAGEFYGQRDLLEFREPFVGM